MLKFKFVMSLNIKSGAAPQTMNWTHTGECSEYVGTFSVSETRTLQQNKAHLGVKKENKHLCVHKVRPPFIVYGTAPDFIHDDITNLLTSLVSGFEKE